MPLIRWLLNVQPLWNIPSEFDASLQLLPSQTHTHIQKYHRLSDRKLALGSQLLQHYLVSKYRRIPFTQVRITWNHGGIEGGRPLFTGEEGGVQGLEYNVSHHGDIVALVSRLDAPQDLNDPMVGGGIGVDILQYEVRPRYVDGTLEAVLEWAEGFESGEVFTREEVDEVRRAASSGGEYEEEKMEAVVKALHLNWTVKEAYVKAVGTGLVTDLMGVGFTLHGIREKLENTDRVRDIDIWIGRGSQRRKGSEWYFEVGKVALPGVESAEGRYCVAIATKKEGLSSDDQDGQWLWIDLERDILNIL